MGEKLVFYDDFLKDPALNIYVDINVKIAIMSFKNVSVTIHLKWKLAKYHFPSIGAQII